MPSPVPQQQYYSPPPQMQPDHGPNSAIAANLLVVRWHVFARHAVTDSSQLDAATGSAHDAFCASADMPQFQGVPQYATTGWASPPQQQQQPPPAPQPTQSETSPSESTSDNIFYAIVALLPELSPKHLVWVKGEVRPHHATPHRMFHCAQGCGCG